MEFGNLFNNIFDNLRIYLYLIYLRIIKETFRAFKNKYFNLGFDFIISELQFTAQQIAHRGLNKK
jgi:hypothetical protein